MLTTRARRTIALLILAATGAVVAWLVTTLMTRESAPESDQESREVGAPVVSIRESVVQHSRGGAPAWRLLVEEIQISGGGRAVAATGLR